MLIPVESSRFRKDVKLMQKRGKDMSKLKQLLFLLINEFLSYTLPVLHSPYPLELADTVDPEYYIVGLRSRGKVLRVNDTKGLEMADMRGLTGISGGPCFLYNPEITSHPYFAGIGIGDLHRKGNAYVTALKIEAIIATLNDFLTTN